MKPTKVLIIEDEQTARQQYAKKLSKAGFNVDQAETATKGWELFQDHFYPVVVTDLRMVGVESIDGLEALEKIKQLSPATQVIVVTGHGAEEDAIKSLKLRAFDYLKKGHSSLPNELVDSVKRAEEEYHKQSDDLDLELAFDFENVPLIGIEQVREILKDMPPLGDVIRRGEA
jgi:DNA-binding NtrC family response regulator